MNETEILAFIIQLISSYLFVQIATSNAAKQNSIDSKRDLRTTKEDILAELKNMHEATMRESEISTTATIDILKAENQKTIEVIRGQKGRNDD